MYLYLQEYANSLTNETKKVAKTVKTVSNIQKVKVVKKNDQSLIQNWKKYWPDGRMGKSCFMNCLQHNFFMKISFKCSLPATFIQDSN